MYFWDEKKQELVESCPDCGSAFISYQGTDCPATCPSFKLESKHQKATEKMIAYCFPKKKVKVVFPANTPLLLDNWKWGWTDDIKQVIYIPWYTLRSKKEFFETIPHEASHITAFEKKFILSERRIIKRFFSLKEKEINAINDYDFDTFITINRKIREIKKKNKRLIDRYDQWEGHDYNPWHLEYLKFHKQLINSTYRKYAYGNTKSRKYGFNDKGEGKYKPRKK
jgi:hypothetical protein